MMKAAVLLLLAATSAGATTACLSGTFDANNDYFPAKAVQPSVNGYRITYNNFYKEIVVGPQRFILGLCFQDQASETDVTTRLNALCTTQNPCTLIRIPFTSVAVSGSGGLLAILEELEALDLVSSTSTLLPSGCLQSRTLTPLNTAINANPLTIDLLFLETANVATTPASSQVGAAGGRTVRLSLGDFPNPLVRLELVNVVAAFIGREDLGGYVVQRSRVSYDLQINLVRTPASTARIGWIASVTDNAVAFTSNTYINAMVTNFGGTLVNFGQTVDRTVATAVSSYVTAMQSVDVIIVESTVDLTRAANLLTSLGLTGVLNDYRIYNSRTGTNLYQLGRFAPVGGQIGYNVVDSSAAAPDLLLSDVIRVSHLQRAPWNSAQFSVLRRHDTPITPVPANQNLCARSGAQRPTRPAQVRHTLMAGLTQAAENPQGAITNFDPSTDYFPVKATQTHAEHFEIEYHLSWKVVRNIRMQSRESYVLIQRGVPAANQPPSTMWPSAKRIMIPVQTTAAQATPSVHMEVLLGVEDKLRASTFTPHSCLIRRIEQGNLSTIAFGTDLSAFDQYDVFFANGANADRRSSVATTTTSDPGPLNRAEWLDFHAAFHNREARARTLFNDIRNRYLCVSQKGLQASQAANRTPRVMIVSYASFANPPVFQVSKSDYLLEMTRRAGGISVSVDNTSRAFNIGEHTTTSFGTPVLILHNQTDLHRALADVDVLIDQSFHSDATVANPVNLTRVLSTYGLTGLPNTFAPFLRGNRIFRFDRGISNSTASSFQFTDFFTRFVVEPDAGVEDLTAAIHPGFDGAPRDPFFLWNVANPPAQRIYQSSNCASEDPSTPLANNLQCDVPCRQRTVQEYCVVNCVWNVNANPRCNVPGTPGGAGSLLSVSLAWVCALLAAVVLMA